MEGRGPGAGHEPARGYIASLLPGAQTRSKEEAVDVSLEDVLIKVDELTGMLDMLCSDFYDLSEGVPGIYKKATHVSGPQLGQQTQAHHPDDLRQRGLNGGSSRQGQGKLGDFPQDIHKTPAHNSPSYNPHTLHRQQGSLHQAPADRLRIPRLFPTGITFSVVAKDSDLSGGTTLQEDAAIYYPEY